jgi:hypothetical protein
LNERLITVSGKQVPAELQSCGGSHVLFHSVGNPARTSALQASDRRSLASRSNDSQFIDSNPHTYRGTLQISHVATSDAASPPGAASSLEHEMMTPNTRHNELTNRHRSFVLPTELRRIAPIVITCPLVGDARYAVRLPPDFEEMCTEQSVVDMPHGHESFLVPIRRPPLPHRRRGSTSAGLDETHRWVDCSISASAAVSDADRIDPVRATPRFVHVFRQLRGSAA